MRLSLSGILLAGTKCLVLRKCALNFRPTSTLIPTAPRACNHHHPSNSQLNPQHGFQQRNRAPAYVYTSRTSPRRLLTVRRGDPRGDARGPPPSGLPRQLRTPPDPAEPLPERHVVRPVEVPSTFARIQAGWWNPRAGGTHSCGCACGAFANRAPQDERHSYEKCQYVEFKKRVAKMDELRESKGGERSN